MRQNADSNGFETWRRLFRKFALPDATRHVSLLTQLLDFKCNPATFEHDFNTWETIKVKYERQTGTKPPDSVLVATLLNKTTGALQQHLRLNARSLTTYTQIRDVIVEYFRSRRILTSSSSNNGLGIGALWRKGKGKGNPLWNKVKGKGKGKGLPGKGKGAGLHWDFSSKSKRQSRQRKGLWKD